MSFFRSDSVQQYKMVIPMEGAWNIMNKLGQQDLVHIVQSQTNIFAQKPYHEQSKQCNQVLNKLRSIQTVLQQRLKYEPLQDYDKQQLVELFQKWDEELKESGKNNLMVFEDRYDEVQEIWTYFHNLENKLKLSSDKMQEYREYLAIVRGAQKKFGANFFDNSKRNQNQQMQEEQNYFSSDKAFRINHKVGVIKNQEKNVFNKTVTRITKGNTVTYFMKFQDIFYELYENQKDKIVFFILYAGKSGQKVDQKLDKLISSYSSISHNIMAPQNFESIHRRKQNDYIEAQAIYKLTEGQLQKYLLSLKNELVYQPSPLLSNEEQQKFAFKHRLNKLQFLKLYFLKEQQIYRQLNKFDKQYGFLMADSYVKTNQKQQLKASLNQSFEQGYAPAQLVASDSTKMATNFALNDYTSPAYQIVSTYGVPRYKEANPAFFTTVTFPFLFGVMFGDIGHGSIVLAFGLYLVFKESSNQPILKMILPYRYLIALMGFFAVFCGFIYNDFLSMSLNLFGSCFDPENSESGKPIKKLGAQCVYPFGVDPAWSLAQNNLNYINSLKMKISVIIAVVHMTLGVFIKAANSIYFRNFIDFFFQFVPQVIFMVLLFGYMDFLIIYKWLRPWKLYDSEAPSIITTMINLPLKMGKTQNCCGGQPLWGQAQNTTQDQIQLLFLLISVLCIPLMLFPKPLYEIYCNSHDNHENDDEMNQQQIEKKPKKQDQDEQREHSASQIFVHQLIQTIQYVLGCISNTASYLRLWALSLAHSQLSEVFFNKTIQSGIVSNIMGIPQMLIGFFLFSGITFGVLLCMDTMQCFLHTLRLHWVEFQNKFYKGDGFGWESYSLSSAVNTGLTKRQKSS